MLTDITRLYSYIFIIPTTPTSRHLLVTHRGQTVEGMLRAVHRIRVTGRCVHRREYHTFLVSAFDHRQVCHTVLVMRGAGFFLNDGYGGRP